ncbi:thyrotroph embryonic factor-like [Lytechinus pictus]|uniref:thyrotroph embryonic factor-like n=1 Tax=Lytechinus pictus TaxID=7653 RepID=UPI00240DD314|nr:thyrotroph embryonic factor-like [Lytechinus pictus]
MDFMEGMEERLSDIRGITLKSLLENPSFLQPPTGNNNEKDGKKDKEAGLLDLDYAAEDVASAFLGPALWEKTPYDDLKLEYMDLDEFLSENGIAVTEGKNNSNEKAPENDDSQSEYLLPVSEISTTEEKSLSLRAALNIPSPTPSPPPSSPDSISPEMVIPPDMSPVREPSPVHVNVPFNLTETDVALATAPGQDTFDPKDCNFTEEELKPQPMIKKSRKIYVPDEQKDDKYWERRRKNNIAAKRSRDARRIKENQIVIRAAYLEKENGALKDDVLELKKENSTLKKIIASYEKRLNASKMD